MSHCHRPVFTTSVAAELTGVHPQTLRTYERKGLVHPARSPGGTRRYSRQDVARVQRINELTDAGVNLAGVERILDLEEQLGAGIDGIERPATDGAGVAQAPSAISHSEAYDVLEGGSHDGDCLRSEPLDVADSGGVPGRGGDGTEPASRRGDARSSAGRAGRPGRGRRPAHP